MARAHTASEDRKRPARRRSIAPLLWTLAGLIGGCGGGGDGDNGGGGSATGGGSSVPLIFQTTFDCPDWIQDRTIPGNGSDADVCSTGDGVSGFGDWYTLSGSQDQVTVAANNPLGAGGKGFRHYRGPGDNNNGGGLAITLPAPVTEMWVRLYMRYSLGFSWNGGEPLYTKDNYWGDCGSGCVIFGIQGNHSWGVNFDGGANYPSSLTWAESQRTPNATGDGQWHLYEYHLKQNGSAATVEIWVDGVQYLNITNANLGNTPWRSFTLGSNQSEVTDCNPDCYSDYDDVAISTIGRIGP